MFGFTNSKTVLSSQYLILKTRDALIKLFISWIPTEVKGKNSISTVRNSNFIVRFTNPQVNNTIIKLAQRVFKSPVSLV